MGVVSSVGGSQWVVRPVGSQVIGYSVQWVVRSVGPLSLNNHDEPSGIDTDPH